MLSDWHPGAEIKEDIYTLYMERNMRLPHSAELVPGTQNYWFWIAQYYFLCPASHWEWQAATADLLKGKSQPLMSRGTTLKGCSGARLTRAEAWQESELPWKASGYSQRCHLTLLIPTASLIGLIEKPQGSNTVGECCQQVRITVATFRLPGYIDERDRLYVWVQRVMR